MNGRDWFMVGCRLFGVWTLYVTLAYVAAWLDIRLGYNTDLNRTSQPGGLLVHATAYLAFAMYLLLGTRHLAWLCYERDAPLMGKGDADDLP